MLIDDTEQAIDLMQELKRSGLRLAIDDFGTGYSSLTSLRRFPLDVIKVDKEFVDGLGDNPQSTAIARLIVDLAHSLGMRVIAEGVETAEQLALLEDMECDQAQGFLFSKALEGAQIEAMLADSTGQLPGAQLPREPS